MKTKNIIIFCFFANIMTSCNIYIGEEPLYIYDLRYINKTSSDINIITYYKGELLDNLNLKKNSTCNFNNIKLEFGRVTNPVFKQKEGTYFKDSILIVSSKVFRDAKEESFKKYILTINPSPKPSDYYRYDPEEAFNLYSYSNKTKNKRAVLALNKGDLVCINFEDIDFEKGLKMYDYEKRGF